MTRSDIEEFLAIGWFVTGTQAHNPYLRGFAYGFGIVAVIAAVVQARRDN